MKKYVVTEWGVLLDFDVDDTSPPLVTSNPSESRSSFKYYQVELFDSEKEAWLHFRDMKLIELEREFTNVSLAKTRIANIENLLDSLTSKFI